MGKPKRKIKHLEILKETAFIMFLYRADYLKYDFIPMNKRIRRVYGQNLNDTVCVVDPVMRGLGVDLDAVARIQAVFAAVQIYGQDTLQNVDKFLPPSC